MGEPTAADRAMPGGPWDEPAVYPEPVQLTAPADRSVAALGLFAGCCGFAAGLAIGIDWLASRVS